MTKDDLITLAMPVSITLLAISVIAAPMAGNAQRNFIDAYGDVIKVEQSGEWTLKCE